MATDGLNFLGVPGTEQAFADAPNAFLDHSGLLLPYSTWKILRWAEYILSANPTYRQALERIIAYFLTDFEIVGDDIGDQERDKYLDFLRKKQRLKSQLSAIALDYLCYNNAYVSTLLRFTRYLACPTCHNEYRLRDVKDNEGYYQYRWVNFSFHMKCPHCGYNGDMGNPVDRRMGEDGVYIQRWNPHDIEVIWEQGSGLREYVWKIPADYRQAVRDGRPHLAVEHCNWRVVQAIKNNQYFRFANDIIYHLSDPALAGLRTNGWGIPKSMTNFRYVYLAQLLFRFQEAIVMDYVIPFRVITPAPTAGAGDPVSRDPILNMNMAGFKSRVERMLRDRRRDPAQWNVLPFPIQYQALGGDATKLAPKELLDQAQEMLLNAIGMPAELYKGTLQLQTAPQALRLFQSQWTWLVDNLNALLSHISQRLSVLLSWKTFDIRLIPVTHADDAQAQALRLQLAASGDVSKTTALRAVDLDYREEMKRTIQEQIYQAALQAKAQETMQSMEAGQGLKQPPPPLGQQPGAQGQGQGQGGGQDPNQPQAVDPVQQVVSMAQSSPGQAQTPQDIADKAQTIANQLATMDNGSRRRALTQIRQVDSTLHSMVIGELQKVRSQARSQGQQMVLGQGGGQQGG